MQEVVSHCHMFFFPPPSDEYFVKTCCWKRGGKKESFLLWLFYLRAITDHRSGNRLQCFFARQRQHSCFFCRLISAQPVRPVSSLVTHSSVGSEDAPLVSGFAKKVAKEFDDRPKCVTSMKKAGSGRRLLVRDASDVSPWDILRFEELSKQHQPSPQVSQRALWRRPSLTTLTPFPVCKIKNWAPHSYTGPASLKHFSGGEKNSHAASVTLPLLTITQRYFI